MALLVWTLLLAAVFLILDQKLAPNGIVTFELAHNLDRAAAILASWSPLARLYAAFGLGLDYLFMPSYAVTIALGVLMASERHAGVFHEAGAWIGRGSLLAALFDAVENFALFNFMTGTALAVWPQVAFWSACLKFGLFFLGILYAIVGWLLPANP